MPREENIGEQSLRTVNQYHIITDTDNTLPRYRKILMPPEQAEKPRWRGDNKRRDFAAFHVKEYVADKTEPKARAYVYHLAPAKLCYVLRHKIFPPTD